MLGMDIGLKEYKKHSVTWTSNPGMWTTTTWIYRNCDVAGDQTDFKSVDPGSSSDLNNIVQFASLL